MVQSLKPHIDGNEFNIFHEIGTSIALLQAKNLFDAKVSTSEAQTLYRNAKNGGLMVADNMINSVVHFIHSAIPQWLRPKSKHTILFDKIYSILEPCGEIHNKNVKENIKYQDFENSDNEISKSDDILIEKLRKLQQDNIMSNDEVHDEIVTMFIAATDTSLTAISNVVLCIAMHPEAQEKCYNEIIHIIPADEDITIEMINKLTYMDMVVKECLRLFPTVPILTRRIDADIVFGRYFFPVFVNLYVILMFIVFRKLHNSVWIKHIYSDRKHSTKKMLLG